MNELDNLREILEKNKIEYTNKSIVSKNDGIDFWYKDNEVSVISHQYSYGGKQGLLEIMASFIEGEVIGFLTAEETFKIIKESK